MKTRKNDLVEYVILGTLGTLRAADWLGKCSSKMQR